MAARRLNQSDLARLLWGTVMDTRGYEVARNRDRIRLYLTGLSYPSMHTIYALADIFSVLQEDIPRSEKRNSLIVSSVPHASPTTQINQKLDRILTRLDE